MTRTTNARVAGIAFLVYMAATVAGMFLYVRATTGEGVAARIADIARHATDVRFAILLGLLGMFCALVLGVTLYSLTRDQDRDLALLALTCRIAEGVSGMDVSRALGLLWLATGPDAPPVDAGGASARGA